MFADLEQILLAFIGFVLLVILTVLAATIYRRAAALRRYRVLDRNREQYGKRFRELIDEGKSFDEFSAFAFPVRSANWHAVEHVLSALIEDREYEFAGVALFERLGYRSYHERELGNRDVIAKSSAMEKLGRMRCEASTGKLVPLLDEKDARIVPVAVLDIENPSWFISVTIFVLALNELIPSDAALIFLARSSIGSPINPDGENPTANASTPHHFTRVNIFHSPSREPPSRVDRSIRRTRTARLHGGQR